MNAQRFLAYTVLACWIATTAIIVGTCLQWFSARHAAQVKTQRAREAQSEASASAPEASQPDLADTPEEREAAAVMQHNRDRLVLKAESASEEMSEAISLEQLERHQFWVEFAVWGCLTLLGSALFAERREGDERPQANK